MNIEKNNKKRINIIKIINSIITTILITLTIIMFILGCISNIEETVFKITVEYPQDKFVTCYADRYKFTKDYCEFIVDDSKYLVPKDKVYIEEIKKS